VYDRFEAAKMRIEWSLTRGVHTRRYYPGTYANWELVTRYASRTIAEGAR